MEWAYEHAGHLRKKAKEIEDGPAKYLIAEYLSSLTENDYQVGPWTILKNISLAYCLTPFGIILDSNNIKERVYLDPFSGSGIAPLKDLPGSERKAWTVGSPIISTMMTDYPFSLYEFGDISSKSIDNLDDFFQIYGDLGFKINRTCVDANELIQSCCYNHSDKYVFAYLDQSGFQLQWNSLLSIFKLKRFDAFLNYQTRLAERIPPNKRKEFFGPACDNVTSCSDCDEILDVYMNEIRKMGLYVTPIRIGKDRTDQYYYHLLHIARKDSYLSIVNGLKEKVESFQGESIKKIWNDLAGYSQQTSLF
jgi:three-Cys-motif partner protein